MISAFILSTSDLGGGGDEDQDHSLLFAFTPSGAAKASTTTLKGLGLAIHGVLESICGEKTRVLRLRQKQHGDIVAAFTHLQVCMVVLTLPGHLPDAVACSLVLQLAQSMVLLAGPSTLWTELHHEHGGSSYAKVRKPLRPLFDRLCEGVQRQVHGPGWSRGVPACVLQPGIMCVQLPGAKHLELDALLRAHEASGLLGLATQAVQPRSQMQYNFYSRCCCLMYRGLAVWSGMTSADTRLTWQLCWSLGVHGQAQALPCQVTMHRVHLTAPQQDMAAVDAQPGSTASDPQHTLGQPHPTSLLILVSACHMVLAVVLTAYDEDIEELAGQVEAHAAVELLAKVHNSFMQDLHQASAASALLTAVSRAPPDVPIGGTLSPGSFPSPRGGGGAGPGGGSRPKTPNHHNSLFMRIIARSRPGGNRNGKADSALGPTSGEGQAGQPGLGQGRDPSSPPGSGNTAIPSPRSAPPPTPGSSMAVGGSPLGAGASSDSHSSPLPSYLPNPGPGQLPTSASARAGTASSLSPQGGAASRDRYVLRGSLSARAPGSATCTEAAPPSPLPATSPILSPSYQQTLGPSPSLSPSYSLSPSPGLGQGSGQLSIENPLGRSPGRLGGPPASPTTLIYQRAGGTAAVARSDAGDAGHTGQTPGWGFEPAAVNPEATHAVLMYDADTGRLTTLGDVPHISMVPDIWDTVAMCRAMFGNSSVAVSAPPKHSRLCMTIQQIEQLSATRSQREGGQRLGSADATPWQYHPEVAGLVTVQQVTCKLQYLPQPLTTPWFVTAYKHADGHETFVIHSDAVDEAAVMQEVAGHRSATDARLLSGLATSPPQSQPQVTLQQQQPGRPGAAKNLLFA